VARFRRAPGDFDAWRRAHPAFDPFALPLVPVKTHVLAHALGNLEPKARELLQTVAAFRSPTDYDTLFALFTGDRGRKWPVETLDSLLTQLEDRGLLGWDRPNNRYDLHPIVRGVVWHGLDQTARKGVYNALHSYFEAIPKTSWNIMTLSEAKPAIELFNALVGLGRFKDAADIYNERIYLTLLNFASEGALALLIAMLESLFPDGLDRPPGSSNDEAVYSQLGHAYNSSGRLDEALGCHFRAMGFKTEHSGHLRALHLDSLSDVELLLGRLRDALQHAEASVAERHSNWDKFHDGQLALCEAIVGRAAEATNRLRRQTKDEFYDPAFYLAQVALWQGDYRSASQAALSYLEHREAKSIVSRLNLVVAESQMNLGEVEPAAELLTSILRLVFRASADG
jgi:tetratricopeptide (TPR) repeat protein